jgi:hypothetical protein
MIRRLVAWLLRKAAPSPQEPRRLPPRRFYRILHRSRASGPRKATDDGMEPLTWEQLLTWRGQVLEDYRPPKPPRKTP